VYNSIASILGGFDTDEAKLYQFNLREELCSADNQTVMERQYKAVSKSPALREQIGSMLRSAAAHKDPQGPAPTAEKILDDTASVIMQALRGRLRPHTPTHPSRLRICHWW